MKIIYGEYFSGKDLEQIMDVEYACYSPELAGLIENNLSRYYVEKRSYVAAKINDKIVGHINFFPCSKELLDSIENGNELRDDDITPGEVCALNFEENDLYIISVAIIPEYRDTDVIIELTKAFINYLKELNKTFPITSLLATTVSDDGAKFATRLGLKPLKEIEHGYTVRKTTKESIENLLK